ncbi:hypothetical protein [Alkalinema sp. FACHB-956]|uniref:hypothetical protein n=1 Tax=Alkalinema sp. FACHB-956 TaxID=2692768 RepID=UPI001689A7D4|nr:hypothetical protein [Alkalinema sp. FACHB-956]MBD2328279.1 hypothetical protein [Alkalinema sp. FACHB-956]
MAYSDFKTLEQAIERLELTVIDQPHLFQNVPPVAPSARLQETLDETLDLASSISTEKARSELLITPILLEIRRMFLDHISLFSGNTFNVEDTKGLTGAFDFLMSASRNQSIITAPVLTLVEAKDNDLRIGLGQCVAQMYAASLFNDRHGQPGQTIYGAVSTGTNWKFLKLSGSTIEIDLTEYFILQLPKILGILSLPFR